MLAFSADPPARWAYPEPAQYLRHYPHFVRAFGGLAFAHQSAYSLEGDAGVALWLPSAIHPDEEALIAVVQGAVAASVLPDVLARAAHGPPMRRHRVKSVDAGQGDGMPWTSSPGELC